VRVADDLSKSVATLFDDVVDEFCQVELIRRGFETWKKDYADSYNEAFIALCLPKLFTPFVKLELVCWNPLEVQNDSIMMSMIVVVRNLFYGENVRFCVAFGKNARFCRNFVGGHFSSFFFVALFQKSGTCF